MASAFTRTLRSIESDDRGGWRWIAPAGLVLLTAWTAWMAYAEVPLYAASRSARVVVDRAVHPIESTVDGRIVAVHKTLEERVAAGDVLVELDATEPTLALHEERARVEALERQIETTRTTVGALERALADLRAAALAEGREWDLALSTRQVSLRIAEEEAERLRTLHVSGGVSDLNLSKTRGEAEKARIAFESQEVALERLALEQRRAESDREAELSERRRALAEAEGARAVSTAAIARLEREIDDRRLRAPAAGIIGELAQLSPGRYVRAGERLGAVVSPGRLTVEADFEPADALGRVRLGQHGELALTGFPRAQFGALSVEVERIASEARDGRIRVELGLLAPERARTPLEHGLPGELTIEVERSTPAKLVLRAVGGVLGLRRAHLDSSGRDG